MADVMPATPTLEDRLQAVERILNIIRGEQRDGYRLAESVDRLGLNAGALQEALLQVDRNQQALSQLGRELEETRKVVVPRVEHESLEEQRREELRAYRRTVMRKITGWAIAGVAMLLGGGVLAATYLDGVKARNYDVCLEQNAVAEAQNEYLQAVIDNSTNPVLREAAQRTIEAHPLADCAALR